MTGRTHDLAAFTALNLAFVNLTPEVVSLGTAILAIGACFVGGLTPDLDQPAAKLWQQLPAGTFFGHIFSKFFWKHRTISHSLLGLFIFYLISQFVVTWMESFILVNTKLIKGAFLIGVFSHLVSDSLTKEGIPWLFPFKFYFGFPPFQFLRIKTGGNLEKYALFPILLLLNGYLVWKFYPIYLNLLHKLI